jgi:hypothetical protein
MIHTHITTVTIVTADMNNGDEVFKASHEIAINLNPKSHFGAAVACAEEVLGQIHRHCFPEPTEADVDAVEGIAGIPPADVFEKENDE